MNGIKSLQGGVHNSLRSSIILFDLPRVVEELTFNSLDAGATKVYVLVNVRACYVKVEDDGCGIPRDGLVIMGERYATSKIHLLPEMETNSKSLGFRGEALASLSDVSLMEIKTKARGMPNAYCKIMKGSNCLFFGIDDQREAVGTSVVIRDLFYNQPVRRNCMQSSPKRVLHSIKKCVLRIALVHPQVLFKVTDIASEDELLCTIPSPSPLPLISDGFGDEVSSSLQELVFSDQVLMLSGYISGLTNVFSTKAFQYLYINKRFVCKGPIHNLLNNLVASFQCSLTHRKVEPELHTGKRHKTQGYPAFLLNLCCPLSCYDLHFEPSRTVVEFKDLNIILSFFEQAIRHLWEQVSEKPLQGQPLSSGTSHEDGVPTERAVQKEGLLENSKIREAECAMQLHQNTSSHSSVTRPFDICLENSDVYHKKGISSEEMHRCSWLKPCRRKIGYLGKSGCSSQDRTHDVLGAFASPHGQLGRASRKQQCSENIGSSLVENNLFSDQNPSLEDRYGMFDREWRNNIFEDFGSLKKGASKNLLNCYPFDTIENDENIQFRVPCFSAHSEVEKERSHSLGYEESNSASYKNHRCFDFGFDHLGNYSPFHDSGDAVEADKDCSIWHTHFREKDDPYMPSVSLIRKCQESLELDVSSNGAMGSFSFEGASSNETNKLHDRLASDFWVSDSKCRFVELDRYHGMPQSLPVKTLRTDTQRCDSRGYLPSVTSAGCRYSDMPELEILNSIQNSCDEVILTRDTETELDYQYGFSPKRVVQCGSICNQITFGKVNSSALFNDETDWSPSESSNMSNIGRYSKYAFQTSIETQDEGRGSLWHEVEVQNSRPSKVQKIRSRRSSSAPPFYKGRYRFSTLDGHLTTTAGNDSTPHHSYVSNIAPEENICSLSGLLRSSSSSQPCLKPNVNEVSQSVPRKCDDKKMNTHQMDGIQNNGEFNKVNQSSHKNAAEGSFTDDLEYTLATRTKWRSGIPQPTDGNVPQINKGDVLSISSGLLHLSATSLIPESISRDSLENARVLLQMDRKFIPVMAGEILVIIDQHAADERIRLEELRQKVLSGEGNSVTYLDSEQELILPEMVYQLLQKYAEQIQKWGWICNIHTKSSESFSKNVNLLKRRRCGITLTAVPCILGINLDDKDLIEFIEQLVGTDGSSTIPPSVLRILNFKACRGAIMFGDSLFPSECSLIVEELRATSLCFQCAHGRPTTVPLLNVASLHKQLSILEMEKGGPGETWHGLRRHVPSVERARLRLESAKRFQG